MSNNLDAIDVYGKCERYNCIYVTFVNNIYVKIWGFVKRYHVNDLLKTTVKLYYIG